MRVAHCALIFACCALHVACATARCTFLYYCKNKACVVQACVLRARATLRKREREAATGICHTQNGFAVERSSGKMQRCKHASARLLPKRIRTHKPASVSQPQTHHTPLRTRKRQAATKCFATKSAHFGCTKTSAQKRQDPTLRTRKCEAAEKNQHAQTGFEVANANAPHTVANAKAEGCSDKERTFCLHETSAHQPNPTCRTHKREAAERKQRAQSSFSVVTANAPHTVANAKAPGCNKFFCNKERTFWLHENVSSAAKRDVAKTLRTHYRVVTARMQTSFVSQPQKHHKLIRK